MKIITWNCNMAFRKKWQSILVFNPDIIVIQECEQKEKVLEDSNFPTFDDFLWFGDNPNKGVGVISFNGYRIALDSNYNSNIKYIIPINVLNYNSLKLYAIWAMPIKNNKLESYIGQIWKALNYYNFNEKACILIGDWNSNAIWDKERRIGNHSQVVDLLYAKNITSVYHKLKNEEHGIEKEPSLFLLKDKTKPYHLDYCFSSNVLINRSTSIEIGKYEEWIRLSDHMPMIIMGIGCGI